MSSPTLKIIHPARKFMISAVIAAILSFFSMAIGLNGHVDDERILISPDLFFWISLMIYGISTLAFMYMWLSKRFKKMPAGLENIKRYIDCLSEYPELGVISNNLKTLTFGELKKKQKEINKKAYKAAYDAAAGRA